MSATVQKRIAPAPNLSVMGLLGPLEPIAGEAIEREPEPAAQLLIEGVVAVAHRGLSHLLAAPTTRAGFPHRTDQNRRSPPESTKMRGKRH